MIAISQNAANQIHKMLAKNGLEGGGLRVGVKAGGCSGYEYMFAWEKEPRATDGVFVGPGWGADFRRSEELCPAPGTELDYDTSLMSRGFLSSTIRTPRAPAGAACRSTRDVR